MQGLLPVPWCGAVYEFPEATVTNCYRLRGLRQQTFILSRFWELEVSNQDVGWVLEAERENLFHGPLLASGSCHSLWHFLVRGPIKSVSASIFTWPSSVSLSLQPDLLLRTRVIGFGPLIQSDLILT